jgi:DNA-binding CsgD family transcriptional regulator
MVGHALAGLQIGLILTDAVGRVTWMNRIAAELLSIDAQRAKGRSLAAMLKDSNLTSFWQELYESSEPCMRDVTVTWPKTRDLRMHSAFCTDEDGTLLARALVFSDVTTDRAARVELSQTLASRLLAMIGDDGQDTLVHDLTPQEVRILRLVGKGQGNQQIAEAMIVSVSTVRSHLKHIYRKLELSSRAEAVRFAIKNL